MINISQSFEIFAWFVLIHTYFFIIKLSIIAITLFISEYFFCYRLLGLLAWNSSFLTALKKKNFQMTTTSKAEEILNEISSDKEERRGHCQTGENCLPFNDLCFFVENPLNLNDLTLF